ncbi:hypothetical protein GCM10010123_20380 [Pilimelia anulata]|uniref:Uncharacterized protein n=1 Tax=Pilimelia anulata TaxID=53371 RepID=A0A8J3B2T1_9ACTN|nr:YdeI/OmpD-associated family protein [Pilimelia anulata]GGJ90442.1 hypothetical protein GCM10010123_20380 [Pilimelia anulata]
MPQTTAALDVAGTVTADAAGRMLVLDRRLDGHDTFLTGQLELDTGIRLPVRVLTLDDITILRPRTAAGLPAGKVTGRLHLPHGWRRQPVPEDLAAAASRDGRDVEALSEPERRYALTYLNEATTDAIRTARIAAIVAALPERTLT